MIKYIITIALVILAQAISAQTVEQQIQTVESDIAALDAQRAVLLGQKEGLLFQKIHKNLLEVGLPSEDYITHDAMFISYNETHEQANWVAHIILPNIRNGGFGRGNELFFEDPKIKTGSAVEVDYFLKAKKDDGDYEYDGFGYDRGHLAPAADFRWSRSAVDSSFYYSNMSPQLPEFNREIWGELESALRDYVLVHKTALSVITLPIFHEATKVSPRSVNSVSIPKGFIKVALDQKHQRGIALYLPHEGSTQPLYNFAITIDEAETLSGFDFFGKLPTALASSIESNVAKEVWFPELDKDEFLPLDMESLPSGYVNTSSVHYHAGEKANVCGHAVSVYQTSKDNIFINLDRKYPNQNFSAIIPKKNLVNFPYDLEQRLLSQKVCISGRVYLLKENSSQITIRNDNQIELMPN